MDNIRQKKNRKTLLILMLVVVVMFGFAYSLVPFYNLLCKSLGINGKTNQQSIAAATNVDLTRTITVQFVAHNNANLPWKFYPTVTTIKLHPGENTKITYFAENDSNKTMTVQAIPSVTPGPAAKYLKKTECFCFNQQTLSSKQSMQLPLLFHIDNDLPKSMHTITLSYTLFDASKIKAKVPQSKVGKIQG